MVPSSTGRHKWVAKPSLCGWGELSLLFLAGFLHVFLPPYQCERGLWWYHPPAASKLVQPQCRAHPRRDAPTESQPPGHPHGARDRLPSQPTTVCLRDPASLMMFWFVLKTPGPGGKKSGKTKLTEEERLDQPHTP